MTASESAEATVEFLTAVAHDLLTHPQPGVAAWVRARDRAARELRDALNAVLAERPSPLRPPDDGSQPSSHHPGPFMTSMRTDREVIVRLNILLPYVLIAERQEAVQRVLVGAADRLGGRITMWDLLYTDVPVQEVPQ